MVATWNPAANSSYYTQQTEYYTAAGEAVGHWYNPSAQLGMTDHAIVQSQHFAQLFAGTPAEGEPLLAHARPDRVPAFDVTLSAPRSVSLLWAFGSASTRAAVEQAQAQAARATLAMLEREAAYARRGHGGTQVEKVALSAACFQHNESRPAEHVDGRVFADPNLHTHCVILNLAKRADDSLGAIHSTVLRDWKMAAGATYHAALAHELQRAGFAIDRVGKNGVFEVAGIDDAAIAYFSARRQTIEQELTEAGTTSAESAALAAKLAKSTRRSKLECDPQESSITWRKAAQANGLDVDALERIASPEAQKTQPPTSSVHERLATLPATLTETQSVFDRRALLQATATALVGSGVAPENIRQEVDRLFASGVFVPLGQDAIGQQRYSTPEMIQIEREVVSIASKLVGAPWKSIDATNVKLKCRQRQLSSEQTAAAITASANNHIAVIEGAPGSGKTTTLAPIVEAYREAGCRVLGAASAWRIANMLHDDLHIESRAVASWLEQARQGNSFLDAATLLIVDEAGLLSSRDMHAILQAVQQAGAKLLLVGDREQLQAIGAGPGLSLVTRAVAQAQVTNIVRQRDAWTRDAIKALGRGDAETALRAFAEHGLLVEAEGASATVRAVVDQWQYIRQQHPDHSSLLIAKTNAEVTAISREVRSRLTAAGDIQGPSVTFTASTPSGHATEMSVASGDTIRFLTRQDRLGVINGTVGTVVRVSEAAVPLGKKQQRIVADVNGKRITFSPEDLADHTGRARLGWAYASTIYGAQGLTVDQAVVLLTPAFDRQDAYVATSRARHPSVLITDKKCLDRQIAIKRSGTSFDQGPPTAATTPAERLTWLGGHLSRSTPKQSTVDFAAWDLQRDAALTLEQQHEVALEF